MGISVVCYLMGRLVDFEFLPDGVTQRAADRIIHPVESVAPGEPVRICTPFLVRS